MFSNKEINNVSRDRNCLPLLIGQPKWLESFGLAQQVLDIGPAYVNNWQRLGRLPFRVFVRVGNYF